MPVVNGDAIRRGLPNINGHEVLSDISQSPLHAAPDALK